MFTFLCVIWFISGLVVWFSGLDFTITQWLEDNHHPWVNAGWRLLGTLGLGRWQMLGCLLAAVYTLHWHLKTTRKNRRGLTPLAGIQAFLKMFCGALLIWLRVLIFTTTPVTGSGTYLQRCARYVQQLPARTRLWVMTLPIMFGAGAVCFVMKILIGRPRPKMFLWHDEIAAIGPSLSATYHSFPSGHTVTTFALLAVLHNRFPRWRPLLWLVAVLVSSARFGAITPHFVGDVISGAALGFFVGTVLTYRYGLNSQRS